MNVPHQHIMAKPLTFALLRLLGDGEFHSGNILAQRLGVSRTSVSYALRGMDNFGLSLYSVRGRGYRLSNSPQWLNKAKIEHDLGEQAQHFKIDILDSASSTNSLLLQHAAQGASSGNVLAVEWQSSGRGRMGRIWHAGLGGSLTFSLLWRFECGLSALSGLSLVCGISLIRALRSLGITNGQLKWPNDVLGKQGKLAGILIEAQGDMLGPTAAIIGIGLNLASPHHSLPHINQPVTSLASMVAMQPGSNVPERNALLAEILRELRGAIHVFSKQGFTPFREEWQSYHILHNQMTQVSLPNGSCVKGISRGVNEHGALILETAQGMQICHTGEISLTVP